MLTGFFLHLKSFRLPVSTREFLTLLEALDKRVVSSSLDDFYALARACLVKDEQHFDRFDLAFGSYFKGVNAIFDFRTEIPEEWLRKELELHLTDEDRQAVEALGGWDTLMEAFRQRLAEQRERHQGGSKWIGTGGTSPFGAYGYNPEGIRVGPEGGSRSAVRVWDERTFRNLDGDVELNTRNIKIAMRRLRRFARRGRSRGARSRGHDRRNRAQCRLARPPAAAGAPQPGQGAAVPRRRRFDGSARRALRRALLGGAIRVSAPRAFLLPQLHLRSRVARQCASPQRALRHAGAPPHLRAGLEGRSSSAMPR